MSRAESSLASCNSSKDKLVHRVIQWKGCLPPFCKLGLRLKYAVRVILRREKKPYLHECIPHFICRSDTGESIIPAKTRLVTKLPDLGIFLFKLEHEMR